MLYTHDPITYPESAYHGGGATQAKRVGARNGHRWSHLTADFYPELHEFAKLLGMKTSWAQPGHYDLTPAKHALALRLGALNLSFRECCLRIRALHTGTPLLHAPDSFEKERTPSS